MLVPLLFRELSIDDFVDKDDGLRLGALIADDRSDNPLEKVYAKEVVSIVHRALGGLDERELHIIRNRFGLLGGRELTLEEIGRSLGLSRERVRQLEREAKDKLRQNLARHLPQFRFSLA